MNKEADRIKQVEARLAVIKQIYENILPIWNILDRKKQTLDLEIKILSDERHALKQGQLLFTEDF